MDKDTGKITGAILQSYETGGGINHIDGANLPSKRALASICEDLLQLLFPGFHDQEPIHSRDLRRVTSHRIFSIADRLSTEVCKSLRLTVGAFETSDKSLTASIPKRLLSKAAMRQIQRVLRLNALDLRPMTCDPQL